MQEQLTEFLNVNRLLYNSQYGFRKAHSTETATLELIDTLLTLLLNTLPLQITAKLYTHSQIGFVNYTKQLFLNGNTSTFLVENCYVCRCVET